MQVAVDSVVKNKELKDKKYELGKWDCDHYVEHIVKQDKTVSLPDEWGSASSKTVPEHLKDMKDLLKDDPSKGTNIVFQGGNHAMLIGVNENGTVDVTHISSTNSDETQKTYQASSVKDFKDYWEKKGSGELKFVPLNDADATSEPSSSSTTGTPDSGSLTASTSETNDKGSGK